MIELEHLQVNLPGMHLIEASAGTGKTYAIALLYLRILVEMDLMPEQILVVTYTEAATKELRGRIRTRIREALDLIDGVETEDLLLQALCENRNGKWADRQKVRDILDRAVKSFDTASIFTIHGFCLRALQENAFESGSRYDTELVTDQAALMREITDDFWRKSFFGEGAPLLEAVLNSKYSADSLKAFATAMTGNPNLLTIPDYGPEQVAALDSDCASLFGRIQEQWDGKRQEIVDLVTTDKGLARSEKAYRDDLLAELFEQMDEFTAGSNPYAVPGEFNKFCSSGIAKGTKPKGRAPEHPLFDICEELEKKVQQRVIAFLGELITWCREQLPVRKQQKNIRFFDDLLNNLYEALCGDNGTQFAARLKAKYQAALIDEFQDTDPVQYNIFRKIYAGTALPLFLIGDPKQAIYSFRGADIFAYMQAAADVSLERRFTLTSNWRSAPELLAAFNTLFSNGRKPFVYDQIEYHPVVAGRESGKKLTDGSDNLSPLQICLMPPEKLNITRANWLLPGKVAAEISRLLHEGAEGKAMIGEEPVQPGDIAVIVRSHRQAASIQDALTPLGIPCVLRSNMTIFETDEAQQLSVLLRAFQNPGNEASVRAALVTGILGRSGSDIAALLDDEDGWEQCLNQFREYHQAWHEKGFMVMVRLFMSRESVRGRLLRHQDGERRLTNLLHCFEVIHARAHERGIGMDGLVSWFSERLSAREKTEEHEIRLETDEKAVKIVTVHISKGLEYPVVFCPFLWGGIIESDNLATFHDEQTMVKDYGSADFKVNRKKAAKEQLAENLRLLYVAITRAKYRCYLYTGKLQSGSGKSRPETSPIVYLLHASGETREAGDLVASLAEEYTGLSAEKIQEQLEELAAASNNSIAVNHLPDDEPEIMPWRNHPADTALFRSRKFRGAIRDDWRVSSFTSFSSHDSKASEFPDRDGALAGNDEAGPKSGDRPDTMNIFTFPRGSQAGTFMHAIFEELDFAEPSRESIDRITARCLDLYGFDRAWLPSVSEMVANVINTRFSTDGDRFALSDLKKGRWLAELEFFFPLRFVTSDLLRRSLKEYAGGCKAVNLDAVLASLQFKPARGVVRGFMDMVFENGGRYYLLDWKSNHLGYRMEDYGQVAMKREMEKNSYPLQYLLYTVALNRYLLLRDKNYDYGKHFGGVLYLFIRGMNPQQGEQSGVFRDLPAAGLVNALTNLLIECGG